MANPKHVALVRSSKNKFAQSADWDHLTQKNILDFSDWRSEDSFAREYQKLLKGLKVYYGPPGESQ